MTRGGESIDDGRRHATVLEIRIEDRLAGRAPVPPGYLGESVILH
jgi:hypothetical protein